MGTPRRSRRERGACYSRGVAEFPHLDPKGAAHVVNVGEKPSTHRIGVAEAFLRLTPETLDRIRKAELKKGDALAVARIGGLAAVKRTPDLLPLAHPLLVTHASLDLEVKDDGIRIVARVETTGPTGVEMEAMTAASVAALNLYDMIKAHDRGAVIERVQLLEKAGGRSGHWVRAGT